MFQAPPPLPDGVLPGSAVETWIWVLAILGGGTMGNNFTLIRSLIPFDF